MRPGQACRNSSRRDTDLASGRGGHESDLGDAPDQCHARGAVGVGLHRRTLYAAERIDARRGRAVAGATTMVRPGKSG